MSKSYRTGVVLDAVAADGVRGGGAGFVVPSETARKAGSSGGACRWGKAAAPAPDAAAAAAAFNGESSSAFFPVVGSPRESSAALS